MEDDDEFGDLYTDVLTTFPSSSSSAPSTALPPPSRLIDLNLQSDDIDIDAPNSTFTSSDSHSRSHNHNQPDDYTPLLPNSNSNSKPPVEHDASKNLGSDSKAVEEEAAITRVLQTADLNLAATAAVHEKEDTLGDKKNEDDVLDIDIIAAGKDKDDDSEDKVANFGIEEQEEDLNVAAGIEEEDLGSEPPIIPGLNTTGPSAARPPANTSSSRREDVEGGGGDDDWDSDSEDDLQIVLNDSNHGPPMGGMEPNGMMMGASDDEDEDDDGEPLVIVADDDAAAAHQPAEDQDWGDDPAQPADGKDLTDAAKPNGALAAAPAPKIGYSNYGYHPFHSQFKYVRPGAAPLPGGSSAGSGGALCQVRPPVNMGTMAGRGRGDWRPPGMKGPMMQKAFHPGFWGSNVPGRGLEFTLPSHKTIFEVDIDSFEEKPWKYPGVDVSDFFNFGLNEESWKEYCKQLEQLRLESTMQSKIRVYESGRAEQEFDPDLPPELAAAAGLHDSSAENADSAKADGALGDLGRGSARVRPPLPTGRAIQVETGYGDRLPSVDTRPPRIRDSDAVIEIVLQDTMDDETAENGATKHPDTDSARQDTKVGVVDLDGPQVGDEHYDRYPQECGGITEDVTEKKSPIMNAPHGDLPNEETDRSSPLRDSSDYHPGSRGHAPTENVGSPCERRTKEKASERSPRMSSGESALDRRSLDYQQEDSAESIEGQHSPQLSSPAPAEDARELSLDGREASEMNVPADRKFGKVDEDTLNTSKDKRDKRNQEKLSSGVEPLATKEGDDGVDLKASRSSENSKATGSSRDHQKLREGVDEEVVQNGRSTYYLGDPKRHRGEGGNDSRRKNRSERMEMERNYIMPKGREDYYSHRDWDPYAVNHLPLKSEGVDRRKERDYSEVSWQRRDEDPHIRRIRAEDSRKQERADDMVSRHRSKARETERSDKDEYLHSRKLLDNGSWRGYHDKDVGLRYRERDDSLKSRHEVSDDHHSKRRKDGEHVRRDHVEKEDISLAHRESSSRRKRERDDIPNQRKRDDQPRVRDSIDDHHSVRLKDEVWLQRERDEWSRTKQSYEENLSRRERDDGRPPIRSSRNAEEKAWVGHSRGREEYKAYDKDTGRHGDQLKRRERVEDEASLQQRRNEDLYARGHQFGNEGKRSRQESSGARNDRGVHASDNQRLPEKKHKENLKKARETEGYSTSGPSKRHQGEKGGANEMADQKVFREQAGALHDTSMSNLNRESREEGSSDDEQHGSKRGRSKLERWTSHQERDYDINKSSSSLRMKEMSKDKNAGSGSSTGVDDESAKKVEAVDNTKPLTGGKDGGGSEGKDVDAKPVDDRHLDTVEKLKRRSERFKLPLTSEKDALTIKKMESEPLPSSQNEAPVNSEVKQERPARKRRWISN